MYVYMYIMYIVYFYYYSFYYFNILLILLLLISCSLLLSLSLLSHIVHIYIYIYIYIHLYAVYMYIHIYIHTIVGRKQIQCIEWRLNLNIPRANLMMPSLPWPFCPAVGQGQERRSFGKGQGHRWSPRTRKCAMSWGGPALPEMPC